ncbi:MAG TPA: FAD-dependent oxidoreductase [Vicinamibacteria bacterium]
MTLPANFRLPRAITSHVEDVFPVLTDAQVARVKAHGRVRHVERGEVLLEQGAQNAPLFVVLEGGIELLWGPGGDHLLVTLGNGQFTGEMSLVSGRRGLVRLRATEPGEVVEVDHGELMALVQGDSELSDVLMRAFMLRRTELIAQGSGDVVVVGSHHSAGTLRVMDFLTRNGQPHSYIELEHDPDAQAYLDRFQVGVEDVPVLICRGRTVLRNPTNQQIAECLGLNAPLDATQVRDVVIVGAGPAGLAATVYGASEGLDVLIVESAAPGGQAGSSSRIENYLGFPTGISGAQLAANAYTQAQKFGAQMFVARGAKELLGKRRPYRVQVEDGPQVSARTVIVATGAAYRKLEVDGLARFEGAGIHYVASPLEAQLCREEEVIVVGGGNSAGQAAVYLAQTARRVHMLVRSEGLAESMSRYLIRRIEQTDAILLHTRMEIVALEGGEHLERVHWRDGRTAAVETCGVRHVFLMMGADPATRWLAGCVALDASGFIKTGSDLSMDELAAAGWPLARAPYLLETSLPGVFAVGDVRAGNLKRVASAVGEGSTAVFFVHQVLRE